MPQIVVENLVKTFRVAERVPGMWGALKGVALRKHRTVTALNAVSFSLDEGDLLGYIGPNGVGKTTSVAKLAKYYKDKHKRVMLAAGDTYRAAAVDQLAVWAERVGVDLIKHQQGADPAAVAFDAVDAAIARHVDLLIVDTAGRLHTKDHLMRELSKIEKVITRRLPDAPHEVILVLDATTGQNAVQQAKLFHESIRLTGLFLSKLDGTAKGGIVIGMRDVIDLPVKFVGLGEKAEDIEPFDPDQFVEALFAG